MIAKEKHSSLLWKVVIYDRKKFYNIGPLVGDRASYAGYVLLAAYGLRS